MAKIRSFPNNQDEYIGAEDVMRWHHGRTSGVFGAEGNAAVSPVLDTMAVAVSDGNGWLSDDNANGIVWWVDNEAKTSVKLQLAVDMSDAALPRIDRVVVSWPTTNYVALPEIIILKGTPATVPVAPALTNDSMVRQISLAAIRVPAGATAIDASMITDERLDASVCGIVTETVAADTSVIYAQFEAFYKKSIAEQNAFLAQQKAAWDAYFEAVEKDTLVPVPTASDAGKAMMVNSTGNGYDLLEVQTNIPVTSNPAADVDLWIDPNETSIEESHIQDKNNPHGVTAAQIGAAPLESLLDNGNFSKVVNQRGQKTYSSKGYAIDRWKLTNNAIEISVEDGYIKFTNKDTINEQGVEQHFPYGTFDLSKPYTFAYMDVNGTITVADVARISSYDFAGVDVVYLMLQPGETKSLVWVALYEGVYTLETLPKYKPKDYAVELLECRRYYQELDYYALAMGYAGTGGDVTAIVNTGIQMRTVPTLIANGMIYARCDGVDHTCNFVQVQAFDKGNAAIVRLVFAAQSIGTLRPVAFYSSGKVALSADLTP